jgi:hypothetical protein
MGNTYIGKQGKEIRLVQLKRPYIKPTIGNTRKRMV